MKIRTVELAAGVQQHWFWCPGCKCQMAFWTGGRDPQKFWTWNGDHEKPTVYPSIRTRGNFECSSATCHIFIKDGQIQFLRDCTHELAGTTVPMEDIEI